MEVPFKKEIYIVFRFRDGYVRAGEKIKYVDSAHWNYYSLGLGNHGTR